MNSPSHRPDDFGPTTQWSMILGASGRKADADPSAAWRRLVERYREPLARALRRRLPRHMDVAAAVDDFFAYLFENEILLKVERGEGRFRCYVQGVLRRFAMHYARSLAGRAAEMPDGFDVAAESNAAPLEEAEQADWAGEALAHAFERLETERPRDARLLKMAHGIPPMEAHDPERLCEVEGLKRNALNVALHRARQRLRAHIETEIRETVASAPELREEMRVVVGALLAAHPSLIER